MHRNLKGLVAAVFAVTALGAVGVAGAQATGESFHCNADHCRFTLTPDGTGSTAHHVFVVKNSSGATVSFTCNTLQGAATSASKTASTLTFSGLSYSFCNAQGAPVNVRMNFCAYVFAAENAGMPFGNGTVAVECPGSNAIEIEISETGCIFSVGSQDRNGMRYHNIGFSTEEITGEAKIPNVTVGVKATGAGCIIDTTKTPLTSEYTTGSAIVTAELESGFMLNAWWE